MGDQRPATLGVIVVTYRSQDVILECLETLLGSQGVNLKITVVDNASPDDTCAVITAWASGKRTYAPPPNSPVAQPFAVAKPLAVQEIDAMEIGGPLGGLTLIRSATNRGFAGGVNLGLEALADQV